MLTTSWRPLAGSGRVPTPMLRSLTEAAARCEHLIEQRHAFGLVTGPSGTGKTDLLRRLAAKSRDSAAAAPILIDATALGAAALTSELLDAFAVQAPSGHSWLRLRSVRDRLEGFAACGRHQVVLLDHLDAALPDALAVVAQLVRMSDSQRALTLLATSRAPVPAAIAELNYDHGWVRMEVAPLDSEQTAATVRGLLKHTGRHERTLAGGAAQQFDQLTRGQPRQVQRLLELALLATEVDDVDALSTELLRSVARELPELAGVAD